MKLRIGCVVVGFLSLALSLVPLTVAQTSTQTASALPRLVRFAGTVRDLNGNPLTGVVGITFALYSERSGGAALWLETQNVTADNTGHYAVLLGLTKPDGLPAELFTSEQAHWVGVQVSGQGEQPRVLLVSAPYALKAGDAETIDGLPASAFVLANGDKNIVQPAVNPAVTGKGVIDYIPMWDSTSDIVHSVIFQKTSEIGIATTAPAATLDVNGKADVRDTLTLFPKSTDNTLAVSGTSFNISSTGKVTFITGQTFPGAGTITGITTASGSGLSGGGMTGTLSLKVPALGITNAMLANSKITLNANTAGGLTTPGAMTLGSTYTLGLKACTANQILQYSGTAWNCAAAAGTGTITGVTAGTDLTGGGTSGKVTLNVDTTKVPQLTAANTFTGNQTVNGTVTATAFSGDGTAVTNVDASSLGGISASGFATIASANYFTAGQLIEGTLDVFPSSPGNDAVDTQAFGGGAGLNALSDSGSGVAGISGTGYGVFGYINGGTASGVGVYGEQDNGGIGVVGYSSLSTGGGDAIQGLSSGFGYGVYGSSSNAAAAVYGLDASGVDAGVYGTSSGGYGVFGISGSGAGIHGTSSSGDGVFGFSITGYAGDFFGNVEISGTLNGEAPLVKMDHPLDPANKYLVHASVASSEMMNIYTGNITTDAQGEGTVQLPEWFEALNTDFRYQLTVIGQFAEAIVAREIENHQFQIRTNLPKVKVSWQVTGVRQDPYAKAHPLAAEQEKEAQLRGFYIHPELYGAPRQKQIEWGRNPELMKREEEMMKHTNDRRVPPPRPAIRPGVSPRKNPLAFGSTPVHAPTPPLTVRPAAPNPR